MTSADQVARLLALVPYLQARPNVELATVAGDFGITPKQVVADLQVLWYCGLPDARPGDLIEIDMDAVKAEGRIRLTNADYLTRPLRFTLDEAMSLVVALRAVREVVGDSALPAVDSILAKLAKLSGQAGPQVGVSVVSGAANVREVLTQALARGVAVRLVYDGQTRALTTTPLVDPVRLATRDGFVYLDAWSLERDDWRTYRVDRIASAELTDQPTTDHQTPPVMAGNWLESRPDAVVATLDLADRARWVAEYYPVRSVTPIAGGVRVELLVADTAWLRSLLLRLGPWVRRVRPAELGGLAAEAAAEALAAYEGLPACGRVGP